MNKSFAVIVPTLNAAATWTEFVSPLKACVPPHNVLIIDSSSNDGTADLAQKEGFRVVTISRSEFNHGATRQMALNLLPDATILVYLTQDAILASQDTIDTLLHSFLDPFVGAAYGRQLPRKNAGPIEAHARFFNYPDTSRVRDIDSCKEIGIKAMFLSNSFAAYRRSALNSVGGFPNDVILGEDTIVAGRLLLNSWKIAYVADACVYHSHNYTYWEEFKRYFDIGVLHARETALFSKFGRSSKEGYRFIKSEFSYLWPTYFPQIPAAIFRNFLKQIAYKFGSIERHLGNSLKRRLSMHHTFWTSP